MLHRLTRDSSGPIDSLIASGSGNFQFRVSADSGSIYLISARWAGIEYFSEPIAGRLPSRLGGIRLLVADTSSSAPVTVAARYLVVGAPDPDRNRIVVDLFVLRNRGVETRVAPDSSAPAWRHILPSGTSGHSTGAAGEFSAEAMGFAGDTVLVFAPISPGADRHLMIQHTLPASARTLRVPLGEGADSVQVVTEEEGITVEGLEQVASQVVEGKALARWGGSRAGIPAGGELVIAFPRGFDLEGRLVPALAALVGVVMLGAGWWALRPRARAGVAAPPPVEELLDRIARLDRAHRNRQLPEAEQRAYQEERARLKQELTAALAAREPPR